MTRLTELAKLKNGWFEGQGEVANLAKHAELAEALMQYADDLILPSIFPTQDGNLLLDRVAIGR
ncbi:MAG: hypothetical protein ACI8T1_001626 [Verrucomicrobiales bacterium]|jgi:hypothetical protein